MSSRVLEVNQERNSTQRGDEKEKRCNSSKADQGGRRGAAIIRKLKQTATAGNSRSGRKEKERLTIGGEAVKTRASCHEGEKDEFLERGDPKEADTWGSRKKEGTKLRKKLLLGNVRPIEGSITSKLKKSAFSRRRSRPKLSNGGGKEETKHKSAGEVSGEWKRREGSDLTERWKLGTRNICESLRFLEWNRPCRRIEQSRYPPNDRISENQAADNIR